MATKLQFKCDGCDVEKTVDVGKRPDGWSVVSIAITGLCIPYDYKGDEKSKSFDLCASCQQRVLYHSYPDEWARATESIAK